MLVYLLYVLFFVSCLVLVATILLQPGKADAGALFTSNISSTAFGPRGTQSVLSRITIGAAICFMLTALLLAMPAITGNVSVLNSTTANPAQPAAPVASDTNTNALPQAQADTITNLNSNIYNAAPANTNAPAAAASNANAAVNTNTAKTTNAAAGANKAANSNAKK